MALAGTGLVAIWNDIKPELREDFFEWHPREHMVERLGIPGFLRGRRYAAVDGGVEFLTLYEVTSTDVLVSDVYKQRLTQPTPWSTKTLPGFFNNERGACQIEFSESYAMGGFMLTLRFEAEEGREPALVNALKKNVLARMIDTPRVTGVHLVKNDVALTAGNAGNQRGRVITLPHLVVLVEGSTADGVRAAGEKFLSSAKLVELGARSEVVRGLYQLEYSIQNLAV
ncbi:hypothetical protein RD110_19500 [Rhodoferax koreense]|uniref:Uncharacterized protein n=1 Tax=Rhodoferax koreensis TaxID=1842727 RepID=A0A1P8JZE4_9BURK|nr:DUF4286 family protein [Rhodoferax koreense]APW39127.1 hypothetical protein RD110_19500 [Rhodoferax koreense]